jgi:hypothetical protein
MLKRFGSFENGAYTLPMLGPGGISGIVVPDFAGAILAGGAQP